MTGCEVARGGSESGEETVGSWPPLSLRVVWFTGPEGIEDRVGGGELALGNGLRDVLLGAYHRLPQGIPARQISGHSSGIGATGAVRAEAPDERGGQEQFLTAIVENIDGLL